MTGILVPSSTGLILGETCESYLNGWTFARSGSTTAVGAGVSLAHAGLWGLSNRKPQQLACYRVRRTHKNRQRPHWSKSGCEGLSWASDLSVHLRRLSRQHA